MNAHAATHAGAVGHEWRGRAGMIGLIIAEGSLFAVFVVAYLYYTGKSLHGPFPKDVLHSATVTFGVRALAGGNVRRAGRWLLLTAVLGAIFLAGTAREWYQLIYRDGLTIGTNLFGSTFYPLVGLHASHVIVGLVMLGLCCVFAATGALRTAHAERVEMVSWYWHFVDVVWVVVLMVVYVVGR